MSKIEELADRLNADVKYMQENSFEMEDKSWSYQEGVLLSGNEAKLVIETIAGYQKATEAQKQPAMSLDEAKDIIAIRNGFKGWQQVRSEDAVGHPREVLMDQVLELYANQFREEQKWVNIDNEQPKPLDMVLLSHDVAKWVVDGYMSEDGFFYGASDNEVDIYPSHWKQLPIAP